MGLKYGTVGAIKYAQREPRATDLKASEYERAHSSFLLVSIATFSPSRRV